MRWADLLGVSGVRRLSAVERLPEYEQALLRINLGPFPFLAYTVVALIQPTPEAYRTLLACLFYVVFSVGTYMAVNALSGPSRTRLVTTTVMDQASVVMILAAGGRIALPMLWAFFWFLVGAGCRHGKRMLALSCTVALAGIAALMRWAPWWQENFSAALGIAFGVTATSIYLSVLVNRLEKRAATDPLTGLSNRKSLEKTIARVLCGHDGEAERTALLLIDLDGFKQVNDAYGHGVGDLLLQRFAQALQARMRRGDTLSRLGGDEFVILARDLDSKTDAQAIADDVQSVLNAIQTVDGHPVSVSASIGVYLFSTGTGGKPLDIPAIMRRADNAMYRAKTAGKNHTVFSD